MTDQDDVLSVETPICPNGLFNLTDAVTVSDADEEILELYMNLANTSDEGYTAETPGGLGFLDSNKSVLELELVLTPPDTPGAGPTDYAGPNSSNGGRRRKPQKKDAAAREVRVDVQLQQDLMALKGRKGDTGSVLWRSSLHLARFLLSQHHFPPSSDAPLLNPTVLSASRILELGSGTGLLGILLNPLCKSYTASDRLENLKLVNTNLELNSVQANAPSEIKQVISRSNQSKAGRQPVHEVLLEEIDWVAVSDERRARDSRSSQVTTPQPSGTPEFSPLSSYSPSPSPGLSYFPQQEPGYELVLAVDCIYNENLVRPLVDTLAKYCPRGGKTVVWVVVELRSSDVLTLFLDTWLSDLSAPWTVVRLGPDAMGRWEGQRPRWVGWVGWR